MSSSQPEVLGKYTLIKKLASGGMAEVFLAKVAGPAGFEKLVVVKRILAHLAEEPSFIEMFLAEARLAAQLNHPNVVQVFDFGEQDGTWFLVMELIDGLNLRHLFRRAAERNELLPVPVVLRIITMALEGLAYAHDFAEPSTGAPLNLVHRDISPDNVLVGRNGAVKVVDFGIAKAANQTHLTKTGAVKGKFAYMPPEQLQGQPLDRRADLFAMGIVLYELLTTRKPFDATNDAVVVRSILYEPFTPASAWRPDVPPELEAILARAFAKNVAQRYPDCRAMAADLDRLMMSRGESVSQYDIAQLVQRLGGPSSSGLATPKPSPSVSSTGPTLQPDPQRVAPTPATVSKALTPGSDELASEPDQPPSTAPAGPSGTHRELSRVREAPAERSAWPRVAAALVACLAAAGGLLALRRERAPGSDAATPVVVAPPMRKAVPDANDLDVARPTTHLEPEDGVEVEAPGLDAGPTAVVEAPGAVVDAGLVAAVKPTVKPPKPKPVPRTPPPAQVTSAAAELVDFRVRPFGTVSVDGKLLGDTPFPPVKLSPGVHRVQVVNGELGKTVTRTFEVKSGQSNVFRLNLEEGG